MRIHRLFPVFLASLLVFVGAAGLARAAGRFQAERPVVITSCGQSPDAATLSLLGKRLKLEHVLENSLRAEQLGDARTLVVVVGGSVKGLAEAGTTEDRESERVRALLARAREQRVKVIAVHMGGESRRGALSDRFIALVIEEADYLIATEAGNRDGLFTRASRALSIPLVLVSQPAEVGRELRSLFSDR